MAAPQRVSVHRLQERHKDGKAKPWVVRWTLDSRPHSRSFTHAKPADAYRSSLIIAGNASERFDATTGEPASWSAETYSVAEWARKWLGQEWPSWSPKSRRNAVDALKLLLPLLVGDRAPEVEDGKALRAAIGAWLHPNSDLEVPAHLRRWSVPLSEPGFTEVMGGG